ncbi:hypothetical protein [Nocardia aurantiaca]|uniref:Uncharacterized protein n=1 Tax=Nocardia aurantiaca TaxID=2675850 RepID=A0A6I3L4R0_9NOCA|nr:hypothetical protein [Nocardia aurantiaca]MTE15466.1 hypothetical protein [Nocardia aurantiaca]
MAATKPTAHVFLTDSAEWFARSALGARLINREPDESSSDPGFLRVQSHSIREGWLMCWAILTNPVTDDDMVEVKLPTHAVSGVVVLENS